MLDDIARAQESALDALRRAQETPGVWRDYDRIGGGSDEWVPAYVGAALAALSNRNARAMARQTWQALRRRSWWSAGWGYMRRHPADADSSTWTLLLAERLKVRRSVRAWRAYRFLKRHQRGDGGIATFAIPGPMKAYTRLRTRFDGWCSPHECVTAASAALARFRGRGAALAYLRARQRADGGWVGYWWADREYCTTLAAEALSASEDRSNRAAAQRAVAFTRVTLPAGGAATAAINGDASAFVAALRLRTLILADDVDAVTDPVRQTLAWLLGMQRTDGGWSGSAWLRFPPTACTDVETHTTWTVNQLVEGGVLVDARGIFTTATVLVALERAVAWARAHELALDAWPAASR